jgi:hypothetical protein
VLVTGQAMPGLTSAAGTFTVTLRNDLNTLNTDQALIGSGNTSTRATGTAQDRDLKSIGSTGERTITAGYSATC